jgi:hypothetical protein
MSFTPISETSVQSLRFIGVAIKERTADGQRHVGILYRHDRLGARFCHFADHCDLRTADAVPTRSYVWNTCVFIDDDEINAKYMIGFISSLKGGDKIPYGFVNDAAPFATDGTFLEMEIGKGLTCASFLLTIFHQTGIKLIDTTDWQVRASDIVWQTRVVQMLRERGHTDHADAAGRFVGSFRYRPEEVAAAAVHPSPPIDFDDAASLATSIIADLAALRVTEAPRQVQGR